MSAREVIEALGRRDWMLATAESCTGGMIARRSPMCRGRRTRSTGAS
jgi:nicotinamide mononucleotide (NMN) deamidase PncC